ncbi:MAG: hypothetical protein V4560_14340 [Bacteroidota bacterium]|jgi:hypothetical protein
MRYLFPIAIIAFLAIGCSHPDPKVEKAHELVTQAVKDSLKDPESYESVSFSQLLKLHDTVKVIDGQSYPEPHYGQYEIAHTYKSKNAYGGIVTKSEVFHLDSGLQVAKGGFIGQHVKLQQ